MKILFVQHAVQKGGSAWSLQKLVSEWAKEHPSAILFLRDGPAIENYNESGAEIINGKFLLPFHGSQVSGMNVKIAMRNLLSPPLAFYAALRHFGKYDAIYLNSSCLCFFALFSKLINPNKKVYMHLREPLRSKGFGQVIRYISNRYVDCFIGISKNEIDDMQPKSEHHVVYNYCDSKVFHPNKGNSLHRKQHGNTKKFIGYFARVIEENGINDFVQLAETLKHRDDLMFCVYGCSAIEIKNLEQNYGQRKNISFYPMVDDVAGNLGDLDLLVVPFIKPHFSRSVIEAAMLGVPSLAYDIKSLNEIITDGKTGILVPLGDIECLSKKTIYLIDNPQKLAELGQAARENAVQVFSEINFEKIKKIILSTTA